MRLTYTVTEAEQGWPAYRVLMERLGVSRLLVKRIRLEGSLTADGEPLWMKHQVRAGQLLEARYIDPRGEVEGNLAAPPDSGIQILYQDDWLLVCNKPPQLVTHPTYLHQTDSLTVQLAAETLHPVNRLDRDTSGLVVLAKNGYAHHLLAQQQFHKTYLAWVHGCSMPSEGVIDLPIERAPGSIMLREINPAGKEARTHYTALRRWPQAQVSLLQYRLETGRTHQLRLHSFAAGWPLVGETLYGCNRWFTDWPLLKPLQEVKAEARGHAVSRESCSSSAEDTAGVDLPGASYQGRFRAPRERIGDEASKRPAWADREQCLHWDLLLPRQALHAWYVAFRHPWTGEGLEFYAPLYPDLLVLQRNLGDTL